DAAAEPDRVRRRHTGAESVRRQRGHHARVPGQRTPRSAQRRVRRRIPSRELSDPRRRAGVVWLSGNFTAPAIAALLAPFGANSARFFTNGIDTRTNGVDVTATYRVTLPSASDVQLQAGYNNTRTRVVGSVATPPQLAAFSAVLFDRIERRRIECGQPDDNLRVGGDYRREKYWANVHVARHGQLLRVY